mgnify:FL=1
MHMGRGLPARPGRRTRATSCPSMPQIGGPRLALSCPGTRRGPPCQGFLAGRAAGFVRWFVVPSGGVSADTEARGSYERLSARLGLIRRGRGRQVREGGKASRAAERGRMTGIKRRQAGHRWIGKAQGDSCWYPRGTTRIPKPGPGGCRGGAVRVHYHTGSQRALRDLARVPGVPGADRSYSGEEDDERLASIDRIA